jgi:hypothetical protein
LKENGQFLSKPEKMGQPKKSSAGFGKRQTTGDIGNEEEKLKRSSVNDR